ncbi:MAG: cysteine--tRNA ligase, partial [Thermoanaerobaculia bacterium]
MTELTLFNTLGRKLEPFQPLVPGEARVYICGPTVYNEVHIGNLRTFLFGDLLRRSLQHLGLRVIQVMNLTDVDDKTIQGAHKAGLSLPEYTGPFIKTFLRDLDTLHMERVEHFPKATEHIPEMIAIIETLIANGHAYETDGSVFFKIASDPTYGSLSGFDLDQARQGERVASDEYGKEDVRDFGLWKAVKPGEPSWESPWGPGRPGWHIECSAMAVTYLGEAFDLHGGGLDLVFPHHENEDAQSTAAGHPFASTWLHHGLVTAKGGEKMSKSLGNSVTVAEALQTIPPVVLRYALGAAHYRSTIEWSDLVVAEAAAAYARLETFVRNAAGSPDAPEPEGVWEAFAAAMNDDLGVSRALGVIHDAVREGNTALAAGTPVGGVFRVVRRMLGVLGLDPADWASTEGGALTP